MKYRFKENSDIDAYGDTQNVIHFKFGDARKQYNFTKAFQAEHPEFCKEYANYFMNSKSIFTDPLAIVNYIEHYKLPVRLYSNYYDEEFADTKAAKEWLLEQYMGNEKLYKYKNGVYSGLDSDVCSAM